MTNPYDDLIAEATALSESNQILIAQATSLNQCHDILNDQIRLRRIVLSLAFEQLPDLLDILALPIPPVRIFSSQRDGANLVDCRRPRETFHGPNGHHGHE